MADYDIPAGATDWDVPLNANMSDINARITAVELKTAAEYNVKTYGAVGNGIADDTAAIQAALDAANAAGGGVVFLPRGQYKISSALTIYSRLIIQGEGDYVTNIVQSNTAADGFVGDSLIYVIIEHLRLTGPNSGTGRGIHFTTEFDYCILRDMSATQWGLTGIDIEQPIVSNFTKVQSWQNGAAGFYIHGTGLGAGTSLSMDSCWAHDNITNGYSFYNMTYCALVACAADNQINSTRSGYLIDTCTGFSLLGCGSENNNIGIQFAGGTGHTVTSFFGYATPASGVGIYVNGATNVGLHNITESNPSGSATAWVQVTSGSSCTIQGSVNSTANSLAANTTVIAANASGVRSYPNGVTTPSLTMTGNIAMGSNKLTGLANGSAASDSAAFGQIPTPGAVTAQTSYGAASANGAAATYSRSDHTHGTVAVPGSGQFSSNSESTTNATQTASVNLVAPVAANATYLLRVNLLVSHASSNFIHSWTGPAGATMVWADNSGSVMATIGATDTWSAVASRTILLTGKLITSSTAGNLTFTYASGTAGVSVTIQPGAQINLERIA